MVLLGPISVLFEETRVDISRKKVDILYTSTQSADNQWGLTADICHGLFIKASSFCASGKHFYSILSHHYSGNHP